MRTFRLPLPGAAAAVALGIAAALAAVLVAAPAGWAVVGTGAALSVSPTHGTPQAAFTVAYRYPATVANRAVRCPTTAVTFIWDTVVLGSKAPVPVGGYCVAALRAVPPWPDRSAGPHTLSVAGNAGVRTVYTIDPGAGADPAASSPTRGPSGAPHTGAAARPGTDTGPDDPADNPAAAAAAVPSIPLSPVVAAAGGATRRGGGSLDLLLVCGVLLFLAGGGVLGTIIWQNRRAG